MYVCSNCGREYENQASFCSACGSPVVVKPEPSYVMPQQSYAAPTPTPTVEEKEPFLHTLFGFLAKIFQILTLMFSICACASARVSVYSGYYSTYGYFRPEEGCSVLAILSAIAALGFSVVCFVFALIKKSDLKIKFEKIASMTLSVALFIASIVLVTNM